MDSLVRLINDSHDEQKKDILQFVEEKFERRLSEEISVLDASLSEKISKLDIKISQSNANMIKWMFGFWVGQIGVMLGLLLAFFK